MLNIKLKIARQNSGITQKEAAEAINVKTLTISRYETGKLLPPLDKIEALAGLYNVPITYLVTDFDNESNSVKQWLNSLSVEELEEIQKYIDNQLDNRDTV